MTPPPGPADGDRRPPVGSAEWWAAHANRREPLSVARIVAAALDLVDTHGPDALTMRRLGQELEVAPASLYRHVENREALLLLVSEAIFADIHLDDDPAMSWQQHTYAYADAIRAAIRRHPARAAFIQGPMSPVPQAFSLFQQGVEVYRDAGFPEDVAIAAVQAVAFVVIGFAATEAEWPDALSVAPGSLIPPDEVPHGAPRSRSGGPRPNDEMFDFLLAGVVAAIERRRENSRRPG